MVQCPFSPFCYTSMYCLSLWTLLPPPLNRSDRIVAEQGVEMNLRTWHPTHSNISCPARSVSPYSVQVFNAYTAVVLLSIFGQRLIASPCLQSCLHCQHGDCHEDTSVSFPSCRQRTHISLLYGAVYTMYKCIYIVSIVRG